MKTHLKLLFPAFALFLLADEINGQAQFGLRAAANIANQEYDSDFVDINFDSKLGFDVALLVELGVAENFAIQPELHFIQKGAMTDIFGEDAITTINYLDLPILGKISFGESVRGFVQVGPSFGYAISGKDKLGDVGHDIDFDEQGYNRFEISAVFVAGVALPIMDDSSLFFDIRYILGISNLFDDAYEDSKVTNRGLNIGVGIFF